MHFIQQSALAVVVFTTASLAVPIDIKARSVGTIASAGVNSYWHEVDKRNVVKEMSDELNSLVQRHAIDDAKAEFEAPIEAREPWGKNKNKGQNQNNEPQQQKEPG